MTNEIKGGKIMEKEKFEKLKEMYEESLENNQDIIKPSTIYTDKKEKTRDLIRLVKLFDGYNDGKSTGDTVAYVCENKEIIKYIKSNPRNKGLIHLRTVKQVINSYALDGLDLQSIIIDNISYEDYKKISSMYGGICNVFGIFKEEK